MERRIVLSGLGNVGTSLLTLLRDRAELIRSTHGVTFTVVGALDSAGAAVDPDGLDVEQVLQIKRDRASVAGMSGVGRAGAAMPDVLDALGRHVDVLVEAGPAVLGDGGPGLAGVLAGRRRGIDVVLANKAPLVVAWDAVTSPGVGRVRYSGCVGGALPTVDFCRRVLLSASPIRIETSLNGTCQLVLHLMAAGATLDDAVAQAQQQGIAETDPALDIDGWDAAVKLVIVANAVLHRPTTLDDVAVQGIRAIGPDQLAAARRRGEVIVLRGLAERDVDGDWLLTVGPASLPADHPLARMTAEEMGVVVHTDVAGRLSATSQESDAVPTAAAVLRDLLDLCSDTRPA